MNQLRTISSKKVWIIILLSCISFFSCKKNETSEDLTDPPESNLKLKKVTITNGPLVVTEELEYTNTNLVSSRKDSSAIGQNSYVFHTFFTYIGIDEKPVKDSTITYTYTGNNLNTYATITFYYYDAQNRLFKSESFIAGNLVFRKLINYSIGQRTESYYHTSPNGTCTVYINDTMTVNSQNQISQIINNNNSVCFGNTPTTSIFKYDFLFDSNKNPYFGLNIMKYGTSGTDSAYQYAHFAYKAGPNNILNEERYYGSDLIRTGQYTYNYNSAGYPTSATKIETFLDIGLPIYNDTLNFSYSYY